MSIADSNELRQTYLEEMNEILSELESTLVRLEEGDESGELVASAFRALHTIKGSSAMFGYTEISSFVHDIENIFDSIRKGETEVSNDILALSLEARDMIASLLAGDDSDDEKKRRDELLARLNSCTGGGVSEVSIQKEDGPSKKDGGLQTFEISFKPFPEVFLRGVKLGPVFRELSEAGKLQLKADLSRIPDFDKLNPEMCYISWRGSLKTDRGIGAVKNAFMFVDDYSELEIKASAPEDSSSEQKTLSSESSRPVEKSGNGKPPGFERRRSDVTTIRVKNEKLDQLVNLVGELVTLNARLAQEASVSRLPELGSIAESFDRLTDELRDTTMSIRMIPVAELFGGYGRLVFELSSKLSKKIKIVTSGGETELDKNMIEQLRDPLMHLIRNSADHGIEQPAERLAAGKPEAGTIRLSAEHSGSKVLIRIRDDGRGLDRERIKRKAVEKGLLSTSEEDDSVIFSKIFEPGFSTADVATDVSGRGVGMDVLSRNIEKLRGSVNVSSTAGVGTDVSILIPLTLAIIDGFMFEVAGGLYIFNLANVLECIEAGEAGSDADENGRFNINLRGEMISCLDLKALMRLRGGVRGGRQIIVTDTGEGKVGFLVDRLVGKHQTVIKPISRTDSRGGFLSGATILGNGDIALVLDLMSILDMASGKKAIMG